MLEYVRARRDVISAVDAFESLLNTDLTPIFSELLRERVKLVQHVNTYISLLGEILKHDAPPSRSGSDMERWKAAYTELITLRMQYSSHISDWTSDTITENWNGYEISARSLIKSMRQHLETVREYKVAFTTRS